MRVMVARALIRFLAVRQTLPQAVPFDLGDVTATVAQRAFVKVSDTFSIARIKRKATASR